MFAVVVFANLPPERLRQVLVNLLGPFETKDQAHGFLTAMRREPGEVAFVATLEPAANGS